MASPNKTQENTDAYLGMTGEERVRTLISQFAEKVRDPDEKVCLDSCIPFCCLPLLHAAGCMLLLCGAPWCYS